MSALFELNASVSQVCCRGQTPGSAKPDANMQPRNTHTHTPNLPFNAGGDLWLTGGSCLKPEPTTPEAEDYSGKGKEGKGRSNRKNITT